MSNFGYNFQMYAFVLLIIGFWKSDYSLFIIIIIIGFIYRIHLLTPHSGWQIREFGAYAPSLVFICTLVRPFVIECQVCSPSTKPQVTTTLHYTITVCCNHTAHSQHCLTASVKARELNLKYARVTGKLNPGHFARTAECLTTRRPRPLVCNYLMLEKRVLSRSCRKLSS